MSAATKALYGSLASLPFAGTGIYYCCSGGSGEVLSTQSEDTNNTHPQHSPTTLVPETRVEAQPLFNLQPTPVAKNTGKPDIQFSDGDGWFNIPVAEKDPDLVKYSWMAKEWEEIKTEDPVRYRYHYDNPFKTTVELDKAKEKLDVLMDHTMLLTYKGGCHLGTGWILDYVLPDEDAGEEYPTKFFIGSDAHVVSAIKFDQSNPYNQFLNDPEKDLSSAWKSTHCYRKHSGRDITLIKEKVKHENSDFERRNWRSSQQKYRGKEIWNPNHRYNVDQYRGLHHQYKDSDYWQFIVTSPKLVYFPYNYLGKHSSDYHFADFAIFEVDFGDENVARLFTRNFYEKYDREKGTKRDKALNFFARPLHERHTSKDILEKDIKLWMAGYPVNGFHHKATSNYELERKSPSRFTYPTNKLESIPNTREWRYTLGLANSETSNGIYKWAGLPSRNLGYSYIFDNARIEGGASGSVLISDDMEVLGTYSLSNFSNKVGWATAIRNMEVRDGNGNIVVHAYDFIEGVPGQNGSYKEQIQKYFLKKGHQTSFSRLRGWTAQN